MQKEENDMPAYRQRDGEEVKIERKRRMTYREREREMTDRERERE